VKTVLYPELATSHRLAEFCDFLSDDHYEKSPRRPLKGYFNSEDRLFTKMKEAFGGNSGWRIDFSQISDSHNLESEIRIRI